jgi:hypothetical protein
MGQIPSTLYGNPFNTYVSSKYDCIGNSGDSYYDKLIGGVECNPVELSKTVIIEYLLSKYDLITKEGLDCIYNQRPFAGVEDTNYSTVNQLNDTNYLQLFTGYLNMFCKKQISISKIIINTIPMGIEPFTLASDGTVEYSTNGTTYSTTPLEITGGETVYLRATGSDCLECGQSAYDIYVDSVPSGQTPLTQSAWLASLVGPTGPQGPAGTNANISGLVWKGTWSATPTPAYAVNDAVQYSGTSYVKTGTGGNASSPPNDVANLNISWQVLALAGMTGATGASGTNGTNGTNGTDGATGVNAVRAVIANTTLLCSGSTVGTDTDKGVLVTINSASANTYTIPFFDGSSTPTATNSLINYPVKFQTSVMQLGAGQTRIVAGSGVTIRSANNMTYLRTQYSACTIIRIATNEYYMFGDITNVVAP